MPSTKRLRAEKGESPPRAFSESSTRFVADAHAIDDTALSARTPRNVGAYPPQRRHTPKKHIPHFHDDYELGEMLKEGAEGQAYICYKKFKFQGGGSLTFREQKFVVKKMNLEGLKRSGRFFTWEKLLQIKRGQSEVMMANVHHHIVRHLGSYEDAEEHELYVSTRASSAQTLHRLTSCACTLSWSTARAALWLTSCPTRGSRVQLTPMRSGSVIPVPFRPL